jgi:hypothetical protein
LQLPENLPIHKAAAFHKFPASVVAEWPVGTFIENLVVLEDGSIVVSVLSSARLDIVSPDGHVSLLVQFNAPPTGLFVQAGELFAAVGEPGAGTPELWKVDLESRSAEPWMKLDGIVFANGVTHFDEQSVLFTDSWQGRIYLVDFKSKTTSVWLDDERLLRAPGIDFLPGANGIARYKDEIIVSSTGKALLLWASIKADGTAGKLALVADQLRADDLAADSDGTLYLCTHIGHTVDALTRDGSRVSVAGPEEGLAGSTACAFGKGPSNSQSLYVTTTGGIVGPPNGILEPARLVRLDVGKLGYSGDAE